VRHQGKRALAYHFDAGTINGVDVAGRGSP
jgi:hypothetical protein